jgi:plasmid stabilization system protein ParE
MDLNINWTAEALYTYQNILAYLQEEWTEKDILNFIDRTEKLLKLISQQPYSFKASAYKEIRQAVIGKQNSLYYLVRNNEILLLTFWDNRIDPKKNRYI